MAEPSPWSSEDPGEAGRADRLDMDSAESLRRRVLDHLRAQGFRPTEAGILAPVINSKEKVRSLHAAAVGAQQARAGRSLARKEDLFVARLVRGTNMVPDAIRPELLPIDDRHSLDADLWRWCAAHWSVPVSSGYGRRLRFLVVDRGHDGAVIGIIGLGDPVFSLAARDLAIGWSAPQRSLALTSVMDAFALGAVPPYNGLLGGKLVAMLAASSTVQRAFHEKYGSRRSLIADRETNAALAMVTTTSALGRSSVYNRLRRSDGTLAMESVGFTKGSGDFHFSGPLYAELLGFLKTHYPDSATHRHARWGAPGYRNKREVLQKSLDALGFNSRALRVHGVAREVFLSRLASNSDEFLRGETGELELLPAEVEDLSRWWLRRWAVPRSMRQSEWAEFNPQEWRLY